MLIGLCFDQCCGASEEEDDPLNIAASFGNELILIDFVNMGEPEHCLGNLVGKAFHQSGEEGRLIDKLIQN